jgi:hypothetical protein
VLRNPLVVGPGAQAVGPPQQLDREPGTALAPAPAQDRPAPWRAHALAEAVAALAAAVVRLKGSLHEEDLFLSKDTGYNEESTSYQTTPNRSVTGRQVVTLGYFAALEWSPVVAAKPQVRGPLTRCLARGNSTRCVRAQSRSSGRGFLRLGGVSTYVDTPVDNPQNVLRGAF